MPPPGRFVWTGGLSLADSLGSLMACQVGALADGSRGDALHVVPDRVVDSATVGSTARREETLSVTRNADGPHSWMATRAGADTWLVLHSSLGELPGSLRVSLDPTGLATGVYRDTIIITPTAGDWSPVRIPVEFRITDSPGAPPPPEQAIRLRFTGQPSDVGVGDAITPPVEVAAVDDAGSVVPEYGADITVAKASGPGTLRGTLRRAAQHGVATFPDLSIDQAGTYTLAASAGGLAGATSTAFVVTTAPPAPARRLEFRRHPTTTTAGATIAPVEVVALDELGNTIASFTGTITLELVNAGSAVLGGNANASAVSGVATFNTLSISKAGGGYRLEATSEGFAADTSSSFAINPGAPDHTVFIVQPSNAELNTAISPPVKVAVRDVHQNVVTAFTGTVFMNIANDGSPQKDATLDPAGTHRAAIAGIATFEALKIDRVGVGFTLVVSTNPGTRGETSAPFDVTAP